MDKTVQDILCKWVLNNVNIERLGGGSDSNVFKAQLGSGESIIIRLFGSYQTDKERESEALITKISGEQGLGPRMMFYDEDGMILEYIQKDDSSSNPGVSLQIIAENLAKLHENKTMKERMKGQDAIHVIPLSSIIEKLPEYKDNLIPETICDKIHKLFEKLISAQTPEQKNRSEEALVLCHNDLHPCNIMIRNKKGLFIDGLMLD